MLYLNSARGWMKDMPSDELEISVPFIMICLTVTVMIYDIEIKKKRYSPCEHTLESVCIINVSKDRCPKTKNVFNVDLHPLQV